MASHIPQEIVNHIIDECAGDPKTLRSCSLISKRWVHRTHSHLFSDIKLYSLSHILFWLRADSQKPSTNILRSVRLVQLDPPNLITSKVLEAIPNHSTSFRNVKSPASVEDLTVDADILLSFICMFPRLDNLHLENIMIRETSVPSLSHPTPSFRGTLTLRGLGCHKSAAIVSFLKRLRPMFFKDLRLEGCTFGTSPQLNDLFAMCKRTVETIKILGVYIMNQQGMFFIDLSPLKGLEEITLRCDCLPLPDESLEATLRTVTSKRIRKITFCVHENTHADPRMDIERWSGLDELFLTMANMLDSRTGEKLEIVFISSILKSHVYKDPHYTDYCWFLTKCRTKAVARFEYA